MTQEGARRWLVLGEKLGDNAQVRVLASASGLAFDERQLVMKPEWVLGKPTFEPGLDHLDRERTDPLEPPWPDLVITSGRRAAMVALWIKEQSGGRTRIVLVGRPKRWPERFDLIIVPPQFRVPERDNVIHLQLPLMRPDAARIKAARESWRERLENLPRPLTAVMVGGQTKPFRLDAAAARDLGRELTRLLERDGGSLYVTTSRRTGEAVTKALAESLPKAATLFAWTPDAPADANPYFGLLAHADRFVVTGDSVSMQVEVIRSHRPLAIAELPLAPGIVTRARVMAARALAPQGPLAGLGRLLAERGLAGYGRDLSAFHDQLCRAGLAVRLGEPFLPPPPPGSIDADPALDRCRARIRKLAGADPA